MRSTIIKVHPDDNVLVALADLKKGDVVTNGGESYTLLDDVKAKHKFVSEAIPESGDVIMYGVLVGKTQISLQKGNILTTSNVKHAANNFITGERKTSWNIPNVSEFENRSFQGYHRTDGNVGTSNYWLVIPLVFCENRNLKVLEEALTTPLGYSRGNAYHDQVSNLVELYNKGGNIDALLNGPLYVENTAPKQKRIFP
ncbi:MAG: UxaA family hydrolase, partial [Phormidesmis sp. FL-bin-119]|nr:UxaA family hydrolase [Pedobacter sp.]